VKADESKCNIRDKSNEDERRDIRCNDNRRRRRKKKKKKKQKQKRRKEVHSFDKN